MLVPISGSGAAFASESKSGFAVELIRVWPCCITGATLTSTNLQSGLGKAATDAEERFNSIKQPNILTPQRYRRNEMRLMRSKDSRDEGPLGGMSARLSTGTRTLERVLRCVRAMRLSEKHALSKG
jgi:hypothetical protein